MNCPKCPDQALTATSVQGVQVDRCTQCGGIWFDQSELSELLGEQARDVKALLTHQPPDPHEDTRRGECPRCGRVMVRIRSPQNRAIVINTCADCRGIWLDGGEFRALHSG